jgi:hypothetical protein
MFDKYRERFAKFEEDHESVRKMRMHVEKNKIAYAAGASGVGCLIIGGTAGAMMGRKVEVSAVAKNTALVNWRSSASVVQETIVQMPARGHRGNVIWCNELKRAFPSQNAAAKELRLHASNLSSQLAGKIPHVGGYTFQNLGENLSETLAIAA